MRIKDFWQMLTGGNKKFAAVGLKQATGLSAKAVAMDASGPVKAEVGEIAEQETSDMSEGLGQQAAAGGGISKAWSGIIASMTAALGGEEAPAMI